MFLAEKSRAKICGQTIKEGNFHNLIEIPSYKYHSYNFWAHEAAMNENFTEIQQLKKKKSMSSGFINSIGCREVGDFFPENW